MSDQYRTTEQDGSSAERISVEYRKNKAITDVVNVKQLAFGQFAYSQWYSSEGFDRAAILATISNTSPNISCDIEFSHDGVSKDGAGTSIGTSAYGAVGSEKPLLAPFWRLSIKNTDAAKAGDVLAKAYLKL